MILASTLFKMNAERLIFIVSVPEHKFLLPSNGPAQDIPAYKEAFATKAQADKYAKAVDPRQYGNTEIPVVSRMTARAYAAEQGWNFEFKGQVS